MEEESGDNELERALHGLSIIKPPKLEDAGLEDCALPPHSIMDAFSRAAAAASSKSHSIDDDEEEEEAESTTNMGGGKVTFVKYGDDEVAIVGGDDSGGEKPSHDGEGDGDKDLRVSI